LLYLGQIEQAVEFAKKANNARTWKEVMSFAIEVSDMRNAVQAA
jgi:hypothetical protein